MKYMDMYLHSTYSDGTFTPEQIVDIACKSNLSAISLTDHDTINGVKEIVQYGKQKNIEIVPGIEFSAQHKEMLHILGFFLDYKNNNLISTLENLKLLRQKRTKKFIMNLAKLGLDVNYEELVEHAQTNILGRPHIGNYLIHKKYCLSLQDAFKNYIGKKCKAYVPKENLPLKTIINLINETGGIPVLAHPVLLKDFDIEFFVKSGIKGIEAYYHYQSEKDTMFFLEIANKYDLFVTGGSDGHGLNNKNDGFGKFKAPYFHLEKIKKYLNKN